MMRNEIRLAVLAVSLIGLGACTQLSSEDKAILTAASTNAEQAKSLAQQALDAARAAQTDAKSASQAAKEAAQAANNAAQAANQAAQAARDETEKMDRMFNRSQRKTSKDH